MARKDAVPRTHGFNDVIGVVLGAAALLLLVALFSYDPHDCSANQVPPNSPVHDLCGPLGVWVAWALFRVFGLAAFTIPVLLIVFGLGYLFAYLSYLQRRWICGVILLVCTMGLLTLFQPNLRLLQSATVGVSAPSAGGYIGYALDRSCLSNLGKVGASIVLGAAYVVCLLYLTNFQLGLWCRQWWASRTGKTIAVTAEERELEKKARELERQAKKLQDQLDKRAGDKVVAPVGLGADGQPVPAPMVRDLSVPQSKARKAAKPQPVVDVAEPLPDEEVEVISANEVAAATTADILGDKAELSKQVKEVTEGDEAAEKSKFAAPEVPAPVVRGLPTGKLKPRKPKQIAVAATPQIGNYQLPSLDLLQYPDMTVRPTESKEDLIANAKLMQQTLAQFEIEVAVGDITKGPTITRYELHPAPGVRLEKITALNNNIAAALKAERINILAPVPGKSSVGVEVPNAVKTKVILRDLFESDEWRNTKARIPLALGKDVYGHPIIADLAEMPHVLIAGSTGSGKSVCISSIIASLLYRFSPDQLRFVMIDPKVVELQQFNKLPHLVVPVVTDPKKVILALRWVVSEMDKRYQIFAKVGVRNIHSFNDRPKNQAPPPVEAEKPKRDKTELDSEGFAVELDEEIVVPRDEEIVIPDHLSYVVVIIDELADLMLVAPADVEMAIARITQMARAAGIHCIVATQRPSVDVITGVIKANIPARVAFQVASKVDSRTILDQMGADKLLGKGDMLFLPPGSAKLIRALGALVTDNEIQQIVEYIATQGKPSYELEIHQQLQKPVSSLNGDENGSGEDEELIQQCIEVIRSEHKASVSLMQRRLRLGYTRAARIMDDLEARGIVGPSKGAEPRDILIDLDAGQPGDQEPSSAAIGK
jgi:S-DNA-T family DNA segregation ATPase FtsK/SpoIIIE